MTPWKDGNVRFTTVHFKDLSDQVWIINRCFFTWNCFFFHLQFFCESDFSKKEGETRRNEHFTSHKNDGIFHIFIKLRFQGYPCKSGMVIFARRVTYAYKFLPLKRRKAVFTLISKILSQVSSGQSRIWPKNGFTAALETETITLKQQHRFEEVLRVQFSLKWIRIQVMIFL